MNFNEELLNAIGLKLDNTNLPKDILFFSGAGISVPPPANFPIGVELHRMLLQYAEKFDPETAKKLSKELTFEQTISRLSILYQIKKTSEDEINEFLNILSVIFGVRPPCMQKNMSASLINHSPNEYHYFFNWHIINGGIHLTVNIDQFIEIGDSLNLKVKTKESIEDDKLDSIMPKYQYQLDGCLLKLHGDINKDESGKQGYLYENVQEFSHRLKSILDESINSAKFVIFIGYGGVDKFDVTPYFNEKPNNFFKNTNALWIDYNNKDEDISIVSTENYPNYSNSLTTILSKFENYCIVKANTPEFILNGLFNKAPFIFNTQMDKDKNGKEVEEFLKLNFSKILENKTVKISQ